MQITKKKQDAFRWLADPSKDNASISSLRQYCPGMDVHYSSGIFNRAFYLLSTRPGWSIKNAFHIFLVANQMYWRSDSDFADAACGAVKAANDLGLPADDVTAVFAEVDVTPCVKTKYNFQHLINMELSEERHFKRYFDVEGVDLKKIMIELWTYDKTAKFHLTVFYNGQQLVSMNERTKSSFIVKPKPGRYYVTITGKAPSLSLYVISRRLFREDLVTNKPNAWGLHGNVSFNLDSDLEPGTGIIVRAKGQHRNLYMFTMYGDYVDVYSMLYDVQGRELDDLTRESLYCNPRPGLYDFTVLSYNTEADKTFTVKVDVVYNLFSPD